MSIRIRIVLCLFAIGLLPASLPAASRLVFPRLVYQQGRFSGIAIANPTSMDASITMTAYNADGSLFSGSGVVNPRTTTIQSGAQYAVLATQIFNPPDSIINSPSPVSVWMEATSPVDGLTGFFLDGNYSVDFLDGSDLSGTGSDLVIPYVENGDGIITEIALVNPDNAGPASLSVELAAEDGTLVRAQSVSIPARGAVQGEIATLFPGSFDSVRMIRVHSDRPVAGVAFVSGQQENSLITVGARNAGSPVKVLYFPQLAQGADWSTSIGIVNLTYSDELVTVTAYQADGTLFAAPVVQNNPVSVTLKSGGSIRIDAKTLFGFADSPLQVGWIKAEAADAALTGYVEYGAGSNKALVAAQTTPVSRAIFSHQANSKSTDPLPYYYTGLAILNPGSLTANVEVMSTSSSGVALGKTKRVLRPRERAAVLIDQWITAAAGAVGGSVFMKSDVPVIVTQLFGTTNFAALSNVPPQEVPAAFDPIGTASLKVTPPLAVVETGKSRTFSASGGAVDAWKVNGVAPGSAGSGTVTGGGVYTAPAVAPEQHTQSVEAVTSGGDQSSAASVDVVQRETLTSSLTLLTAVAYFQNLQRFFVAEQQVLSSSPGDGRAYATVANTRISEVSTTGTATSFFSLANDTVSKMVPFTDGGGDSHLLLAGLDTGTIYRLTLSNKAISTVATGLVHPSSMALDPVSGNLYVSEGDPANRVTMVERSKFDSSSSAPSALSEAGPVLEPLALSSPPRGIAFDPCTGALFVSTADGILHQFLSNLDSQVVTGLNNPGQVLVLQRQGMPSCVDGVTVFVAENGATPRVAQIDPRTGGIISFLDATQTVRDLGFFDADSPFTSNGEESIIIGEGPVGTGLSRVLVVRVGRLYRIVPDDSPLSSGLEFYPAGALDGGGGGGGTGSVSRITYYDRVGDTFATIRSRQAGVVIADISSISVYQVGGQNIISVTLTKPVVPASAGALNSLYGFIDLDTTRGTGSPSHADPFRTYRAGDPETDAYIDLATGTLYNFSAGPSGGVAAATQTPVGLYFLRNTFTAVFPLSVLDALKCRVNVTVGNRVETTDIAPEYRFAFLKLPSLSGRTVQFARASGSGPETTSPVSIDVTLSSASTQAVTVQYATSGGTATGNGVDYTLPSGTLTFAPGETTKQISLAVLNDTTAESDETVIVSLFGPQGASLGTASSYTYTITDDDSQGQPTVHFSTAASSGLESVGSVSFAVTLSPAATQTVTVQYAVTGGTATRGSPTAGGDYSLTDGTLSFAPGETTRSIPMTVVNDTTNEPDETVIVTLSNAQGALLVSPSSYTYTILDDDNPTPRIQFSTASSSGSESQSPVTIAVTISAAPTTTVSVDYAVTGGTATNSASPNGAGDYNLPPGTLTFSPTEPLTKNITFSVVNDSTDEPDETIIVTLSNPQGALLGSPSSHTYTITDDDNPTPRIQFSTASSSGSESQTTVNLAVTLSAAPTSTVSVSYAVTGGTANQTSPNGAGDYNLPPGTLTFSPTEPLTKNITFSVVNDSIDEPDETIIVTLSNPQGALLGSPASHTYTITDDDPAPTVQFSSSGSNGGETVTPVNIVVTLSALSGKTVTVQYDIYGKSTATGGGVDYTLAVPGTLTFAPGERSKNITMTINNDTLAENDETVMITLGNAGNATVGSPAMHTYTILDNDVDLLISTSISVTPTTVLAGLTVTLSSWTVVNVGGGAATFSNGFYLSTDQVITSSDTYLDGNSNSFAGRGSFTWGGPTLTIPRTTKPGPYYIGILVDRANAVAESNEGNNYRSTPLQVTVLQPPSNP